MSTEKNQTIKFAKAELIRYSSLIFADFNSSAFNIEVKLSEGEIPLSDDFDEIYIHVKENCGIISGSNPCATLIAVYRFLRECGCRFLYPGEDGEYLPRITLADVDVNVSERADMDIRCMVIEGSVSYDHVCNMVDFCPKIGLNHYQLQFKNSAPFFEFWSNHEDNPYMSPEPLRDEDIAKINKGIRGEVKKRGLKLQTMGHGWTVFPIGLDIDGWGVYDKPIDDETKSYLAMLNGKRELYAGNPFESNLCYSNPRVIQKIEDYMVKYCRENPEVDLIHFALSDRWNVCCECESCASHRVSDLLVKIFNRLDERMSKEGFKHKIGIAAYLDMMWPPLYEKLNNPDRFVLGIYPIAHVYYESIPSDGVKDIEPKPFKLNKNTVSKDCAENLAYLRAWHKREPDCKLIVGEYHWMWDHYCDFGYQKISRVFWQDIKNYKKLGVSGMLSYQSQRCGIPSSVGLLTYGHTLWNTSTSFDALCEDYFKTVYGDAWRECYNYLTSLSEIGDMKIVKECSLDELKQSLEKCYSAVEEFLPKLESMPKSKTKLRANAFSDLIIYSKYLKKWLNTLILLLSEKKEESDKEYSALTDWLWYIEADIHERWDIRILIYQLKTWYGEIFEKLQRKV